MNPPTEIAELAEKYIKSKDWSWSFSGYLNQEFYIASDNIGVIYTDNNNSIIKLRVAPRQIFFNKEEREYLDKVFDFRLRESAKDELRKLLFK